MENVNSVCIIEDENEIVETMTTFLENRGFKVFSFESAELFYANAPKDFKGLYLVDWNLPGEPGIEIISKIRMTDKISPIFMVSAFTNKEDIVAGLERGADDYITKPFSFDELTARVKNSLSKFSIISNQATDEQMKLLPEAKSFIKEGQTVSLTKREYIIFEYLFNKLGLPVTREELIDQFSNEEKMTERNIDVHVFSLRKKIKVVNLMVETIWGIGYKLSSSVY